MLNSESLITRIKELMEQHELNASSFAEMIGVQRSSISHILSGRNKPSLEFLTKIEAAFDEVSFEWLLKGEEDKARISTPSPARSEISPGNESVKIAQKRTEELLPPHTKDDIVKIVHYYADGSFDSFFKR
jgi:transcriptional regulator with XRE-family HTH domain